MPTIEELIKRARVKGTKIYAVVKLTSDGEICVEVKKVSFLDQLSRWSNEDLRNSEMEAQITDDGDIII
jgi:hypothetical protein